LISSIFVFQFDRVIDSLSRDGFAVGLVELSSVVSVLNVTEVDRIVELDLGHGHSTGEETNKGTTGDSNTPCNDDTGNLVPGLRTHGALGVIGEQFCELNLIGEVG